MNETESNRAADLEDEERAEWEGMGQTAFTTRPVQARPASRLKRAIAKVRGLANEIVNRVRVMFTRAA